MRALLVSFAVALFACPAQAGPRPTFELVPLVAEGEAVGDTRVDRVEVHPEYQRYWLVLATGTRVPVEVTTWSEGHDGLCRAGELDLYPRDDLAQGAVPDGTRATMATLCPRLAAGAQAVSPPAAAPAAPSLPAPGRIVSFALLALVGSGLALLVRSRARVGPYVPAVLAVAVVAGLARVLRSPPGIWNGAGAAYEKLRFSLTSGMESPYGWASQAVFAPLGAWLGPTPDVVFRTNQALSTLAPCLLAGLAWLTLPRAPVRAHLWPGLGAGLALALSPPAVALAGTEAMHVLGMTLLLATVLAAAAWRAGGGGLAAVALVAGAVGTAQTRPELAVGALWSLAWVLPAQRRGRWWLAGGVVLIAGLTLASHEPPTSVVRPERTFQAGFWTDLLSFGPVGTERRGAASLWWESEVTSRAVTALALLGATCAPRSLLGRVAFGVLLLEAPFWGKVSPLADGYRLQLAASAAWCLLVAAGVDWLAGWRRGRGWLVGLGLLAAVRLVSPPRPDWAHHREYAWLAAEAPTLPEGTVWVVSDEARVEAFGDVVGLLGPTRWRPWSERVAALPGELAWLGLACEAGPAACDRVREACTLIPYRTTRLGPPSDDDLRLPAEGIEVGLYRIEACR